jgi:CBS domain-containing protein
MKGSAISVRIADFLKDYPPFSFMEIDFLREIASRGKVKFHEDGEIVFSAGQPRDQWIYVIQRGKLRVIDESGDKEMLIDYRGAGDILGLQGIRSEEPYLHTCKTETEVILYALPRASFVKQAEKTPEARRYLAAYFSLSPAYNWDDVTVSPLETSSIGSPSLTLRKGGLQQIGPTQRLAVESLSTVDASTPTREVAKRLQSKRVACVLVVDEAGKAIGKLTDADLRDRVINGSIEPNAPVGEVMFRDLVFVGPNCSTGELLLILTRYGKAFLVVTEDGTHNSPVVGCISERSLFLQYGRFPTVIGNAIHSAPDVASLRLLRDRIEALILEYIEDRSSMLWLMDMTGILNRALIRRVVALVQSWMAAEGWETPEGRFSWLMMGSGGRDELMIRSAVYHALVFDGVRRGEEEAAQQYYLDLARRVGSAIRQCGFQESPQGILAFEKEWCLPLSEMQEKFRQLMRYPSQHHVYGVRDAFDFFPALQDDCPLADALLSTIETEVRACPDFIRHMARDSLMNQPPQTIFEGKVFDDRGTGSETLAIKQHVLLPLVDAARVFALANGILRPSSTYARLQRLAEIAGEGESSSGIFREGAEAFLVALYARVSHGLKTGTDGTVITPSSLDSETEHLLVTGFRAGMDLLQHTATTYAEQWRR